MKVPCYLFSISDDNHTRTLVECVGQPQMCSHYFILSVSSHCTIPSDIPTQLSTALGQRLDPVCFGEGFGYHLVDWMISSTQSVVDDPAGNWH